MAIGQTSKANLVLTGQQSYRDGKYEDALGAFNEALASLPHPVEKVEVLDHIVGVHVKLKQLDRALDKAKLMIRCDRSDVRGYLRCGQLKKLQEDPEQACRWYTQGLKNTNTDDRLRHTLTSSLRKCQELAAVQRSRSKARDPWTCLPTEIISMLLAHFDYMNLVQLLAVCKSWNKFLLRLPPLVDTIDFSRASKPIALPELRAAVQRLKQYPKYLDIRGLTDPAARYLSARFLLWATRPNLHHLTLKNSQVNISGMDLHNHPLRTLILYGQTRLPFSNFDAILMNCPTLEAVTVSIEGESVGHLFRAPSSFRHDRLRKLILRSSSLQFSSFAHFPNLEALYYSVSASSRPSLLDLSTHTKLRSVEIVGFDISLYLPAEIEKLKYFSSGRPVFENLTSLKQLDFIVTPMSLAQCLKLAENGSFRSIRMLGLSFHHFYTVDDDREANISSLTTIFEACSQIEHLKLKAPLFGDEHLAKLIGNTPKLESIVVEQAEITGSFLGDLLRLRDSRVKSVGLYECSRVAPDTWDWMRRRGVEVHGRRSTDRMSNLEGGRPLIDAI